MLERPDVASVGGPKALPRLRADFGEDTQQALRPPFRSVGVDEPFAILRIESYVDSLAFGCYRREACLMNFSARASDRCLVAEPGY